MFHGFLRIGEVAANANNQGAVLQLNDCKVSPKSLTLSLSKFKHNISNNPFHISIEAYGDKYCPVKALHNFLKLRALPLRYLR